MKRIAIFAALALSTAAVAHADPVTIEAPKAPISAEAAEAYVIKLEKAVKAVCREASAPVVGIGFYAYLECVKATRADVAKKDPTGLYAAKESADSLVIASK
jgi:hypothetical protein